MSHTYTYNPKRYHRPHLSLQRETRLLLRTRKQRDREEADTYRGIDETPPALQKPRTA